MVKNLTILIFIGKQIKVTNKQHQKVSNKRQEWWVSHDFLLRVTQLLRQSDPKENIRRNITMWMPIAKN